MTGASAWRHVAFVILIACAAIARGETALSMTQVAPGNYAHRGHDDVATRANGGDIANVGFIVGTRCVAVVDTGGTLAEGRALRAAIRAVTALPVCYVINTHMHPDHIFGNAAFKDDHPQFVGSKALAQAEASRADNYMRALNRELGDVAAGSEIVAPTMTIDGSGSIDLGGRTLTLRTWKTAHTNNDLTVYDEKSGTLWTGDLLFAGCIPVIDGSVVGWLDDIARIRQMNPRHVVPGHGPLDPPWPQSLDAEERYLANLARDVRAAIKRGETIRQAVDNIGVDQKDKWLLYDIYHRRNVTAAYAELEWEQ
ncbi:MULTISPECIES: quinoprotein relay system zinc metallohydrolase 2 [Caballeronia]|uniref:quinoprotein relay system zinc metallohydrolase 2 n=1 Tax=Caballeronia TaxID=1827195 RepID=UPI00045F0D9A|nr:MULTISPECIES: quinoprotein relay system zinc metallohydrolase 2 [unclassified Caballeronia]MCE4545476.1 quinoprotein relay system zinc metallohydrolase 2 [Caballeronia sp. PC1]MCE4570902.1 quinoprotein relay system zinc metallohydrolase 2 [Caballeronia sp. CLC5]BAO88069.1 beta-lactamase domain protein [Burkholderia sp. RPE67]BBP99254.1 MBL fold metallo-hydrolase [Burkholderia sp. SFA1]